jgi:hypothetical protein
MKQFPSPSEEKALTYGTPMFSKKNCWICGNELNKEKYCDVCVLKKDNLI